MNLVDSSGWLEYFADGPNAEFFAPAIEDTDHLLVSTINLYEVFKRVLQQKGENQALQAVALMHQGQVLEINAEIAIAAAKLSDQYKLPMADSLILTTAQTYNATLWTQDADFKGFADIKYIVKK